MRIKSGTLLVLVCLPVFALVLGTALWGRYLAQPGPLAAPVMVVINPGASTPAIAQQLHAAHVIHHPLAFQAAVRLMGLASTLKAGEYMFDPAISLRATVNKLALGDTENRSVTIPEGFTVAQIAQVLVSTTGLTGSPTRPPEGHLFPDTYHFRFGTDRAKLIASMEAAMDKERAAAWATRAQNLPYSSPEDLLIMASIVQKEAANEAEMPRIASVFVNRLKKGMLLQSDPTVIYGAEFTQGSKLLKRDLTEPQPFNTYVYKGLPPTPIANPGRAALMAAARPATEDYLFFVADPARTHHVFTKTYEEHKKAVARYWKEGNTGLNSRKASVTPSAVPGSLAPSVSAVSSTKSAK